MIARPGRRALGRALGLLAVACVGASALAPTAAAQDVPPGAGPAPTVTLIDQPLVVAPDGSFGVLVAVEGAPTATDLAIDIYDRVEPGEVVGVEPPEGPEATFNIVPLPGEGEDERRNAGFSIELFAEGEPNPDPAWGYRIDEPGVYPVRIRVRDGDDAVLAVLMTAVVRLPGEGQEVAAAEVALLADAPQGPPADTEARAAGEQADLDLVDELAPILDALEARPELPATWALTPDAVARLAADEAATDDLARLRAALEGDDRTLLDAPYVDIDAASLVDAGLEDELTTQRDLGRSTLTELLEAPVTGTWRLRDRVDPATLAALRQRGIFRTVLPGDALAGDGVLVEPVDVAAGDLDVRALITSDLYALGAAAPDDPVLAAHRLLARVAASTTDRDAPTTIVVGLDAERADPAALDLVLDALLVSTPFYAPVPLDDALDGSASPAVAIAPTLPDLGRYPAEVRRARSDLASYSSMVGARPELLGGYERTLAVSAASELELAERRHDAASVTADLEEPFGSISIPATDKVTLGGRDATFPLPIESTLDEPVQVVIELEASDRIELPSDRIEATLDSEREVVDIRVRTRASGDTPVRVTVRSPDDGVVLAEGRYVIRSTAVSSVGIFLTVGAAAFLALWWGRHWRRARRAKADAQHEADDDAEPAADPTPAGTVAHDGDVDDDV